MSQQIIQIPLDKIITGKQIRERFDEESLTGLTQSLRENGQHEPIHVLPLGGDHYSLLTGGRRVRAARKAGWTSIAAIVEVSDFSKSDIVVRQIIENAQREDLTPLEKAKAIDLVMKETGWSGLQTAAKLGFTNGTVTKLLALLSLPEPIQQRIRSGELPATAAYELSKVSDSAEREQLASMVADGELTRDGLTGTIKGRKRNRRAKRNCSRRAVSVTVKLESRQSVTVIAPALDLNSFITIIEHLLARAHQARSEGLSLDALLKRLRDKAHSVPPATEAA